MDTDYLLLIGSLFAFNNFSAVEYAGFTIEHDTASPKFNVLREKYPVKEAAGDGGDFSKAVNLTRWVNNNVLHNNGAKDVEFIPKDSVSILDYSFGKGRAFGVYCRLQAIVLTECCLSIGLPARTIHCLPFSPYDFESHVVSMVWIEALKKWVMLDPGNNAYFTDKDNTPLSPLEARQLLGVDECFVSDGAQKDPESYKKYMAKNLFYIKCSAVNTFGTDMVENQKTYHLVPLGFDVKNREVASCEYAIKNLPEGFRSDWETALGGLKRQNVKAVSEEQFFMR